MKQKHKPRYLRKRRFPLAALLVLLGIITVVGGLSAKYVQDIGGTKAAVRAKEFYFSSDFLKVGGATYTLNPGTESITIELRNHEDQLRYSEGDITCQVTVDNGATVEELADGGSVLLQGGKISGREIRISNLQDGHTYTVTAKGKAGYEKILVATFEVRSLNQAAYKYLEMDPSGAFVLLTVWTEDVSGNVTISIPAGLIPDETDSALTGIQNYNGTYNAVNGRTVGKLGTYSSRTYRFFLENPFDTVTLDQFVVKVGEHTAQPGTPA